MSSNANHAARPLQLPPAIRAHTDTLVTDLKAALADNLAAVVVYGSAVRGGYDVDHSDVDVMVILRDDPRLGIEAMANALAIARLSARIECMILRHDDLHAAADVFPLLYDDVRSCHALLHGQDPFAGLVIHDHHRRLRIEQELREMRIRLRRVMADHVGNHGHLGAELRRKHTQLRSPLYALLQLRSVPCTDDGPATVLTTAGRHFDVDVGALSRLTSGADHDTTMAAADALRTLLTRAIAAVEALDPETTRGAA